MPQSFLEFWSFWTQVAFVVLSFLAASVAVLSLIFGVKLGHVKDDALAHFQAESSAAIEAAKAQAAKANEGSEKAKADAAQANERAALAQERALKFELELAKVNRRIDPREITADQRDRLIEALKGEPTGLVR